MKEMQKKIAVNYWLDSSAALETSLLITSRMYTCVTIEITSAKMFKYAYSFRFRKALKPIPPWKFDS